MKAFLMKLEKQPLTYLVSTQFTFGIVALMCSFMGAQQSLALVLDEVIVTAQKTEENLQDVSVSVTAFSGEQLDALGLGNTTDITQQVPNLQLNSWSPNLTILNLRGVSQNNFTDHLEAPVAVYFDEGYLANMNAISGQLFDMERVEVLRGPQGTLFGRNATGGLLHYLSREADETETNGYLSVEAGSFSRSVISFAVGGGSDKARARLSLREEEADGYIESVNTVLNNLNRDVLPGSGQDIGGADGYALRLNLQFDFTPNSHLSLWLKTAEDDDIPTGGYVFENCAFEADGSCPVDQFGRAVTLSGVANAFNLTGGADVHEHYGEQVGFLNRQVDSLSAKYEYQINENRTFSSITHMTEIDKKYLEDGDASVLTVVNFRTDLEYEQISQEFRASGEDKGIKWQVGSYYLEIDSQGDAFTSGAPAYNNINGANFQRIIAAGGTSSTNGSPMNSFNGALATQRVNLESVNLSLFGDAEFRVRDNVTISAGLRFSQDEKEIDWALSYTDVDNTDSVLIESSDGFASQNPDIDEISYDDVAARLAVDVQITDDLLFFTSFNRGIKGGNWTAGAGANLTSQTFRHDEEVLHSLELGIKADVNDSLRINATFYSYDYTDYQVFSLAGGAPFVENTDAEAMGGEFELFYNPNPNFDMIFGFAFSDSSVDEVRGSAGGTLITDAELPNAPDFSANFLFRYTWFFKEDSHLAIQLDGAHYGDQFLEVTNGSGTEQEAYQVANFNLSYQYRDDFSVTAWIKNLTDEEYKLYSLDLGALGVTSYYAPPMTSGLTLKYTF
jgi:iron complex outermembrane receptor protein